MEIAVGVDAACATSVGGRTENQDRYALAAGLAVVSDGVGGHAGGGRAAELTVRAVQDALAGPDGRAIAVDEATLVEAFRRANDAVRQGRRDDPSVATMGATLALAAVTAADPVAAESWWLVANVGDSPAWLVTPERAVRVTRDHTLAAELVRAGALSADAADRHPGRHTLVRSIGSEDDVTPDTVPVTLGAGDTLLLASDGLADVLDADAIHRVVAASATAEEAARRLVDAALAAGASDNITTAVVRQLASSGDGFPVR